MKVPVCHKADGLYFFLLTCPVVRKLNFILYKYASYLKAIQFNKAIIYNASIKGLCKALLLTLITCC